MPRSQHLPSIEVRMTDTRPFAAVDLGRDAVVDSVASYIVDVPTVRKHKLSSTSVTAQNSRCARTCRAARTDGG
jgi:hypothetical protein